MGEHSEGHESPEPNWSPFPRAKKHPSTLHGPALAAISSHGHNLGQQLVARLTQGWSRDPAWGQTGMGKRLPHQTPSAGHWCQGPQEVLRVLGQWGCRRRAPRPCLSSPRASHSRGCGSGGGVWPCPAGLSAGAVAGRDALVRKSPLAITLLARLCWKRFFSVCSVRRLGHAETLWILR